MTLTTRILATVMSSLLLGAALLPGGCATSRPHYSTSYFTSSAVSEGYRTDRGPVLAVYGELDGSTRGPTPYGRTDIAESFAESFALFKADPTALRRVNPEVYRWFAQGRHLKALADVLGEGPALLSRWSSEPGATVAQPR